MVSRLDIRPEANFKKMKKKETFLKKGIAQNQQLG
jgi:hypothetical protein